MIPILIAQIILFPILASTLMNVWVTSRNTLVLQDAASNLGSTLQQTYFALDHPTIPNGTETSNQLGLPPFIDGYSYTANATLQQSVQSPNSSQVLDITFRLVSTTFEATSSVVLGPDAQWNPTTVFESNSTNTCVCAEKLNGTVELWFGDQ